MEGARKRRKWDVAAPGGLPLAGNRAGIGAGGSSQSGMNGFITAQGHQASVASPAVETPGAYAAAPVASQHASGHKPGQPIDQATIARAQQGAQAIVERINAELRAKGQLPALRGSGRFPDDSKDLAREVPINDAPPHVRYNLTKRSVQDDIQRRTNTIVVIKGSYQAPGMPADDIEGPLRLRVMPGNVGPDDMVKQRAVDAGANEVRRILQGGSTSRPAFSDVPPPDRLPGSITAGGQPLQAAAQVQQGTPAQHGHFAPQAAAAQQPPQAAQTVPLYVGVEAAPSFNLHQRLRGPGDSYLKHISSATGASVTLRGRGSGMYDSPDHLHLFVSAINPKSFEDAKGLCVNLIDTMRAEHARALSAQQQMTHQANMPHVQPTPFTPTDLSYHHNKPAHQAPSQPQAYLPRPAAQSSAVDMQQPPYYPQTAQYPSTPGYPPPAAMSPSPHSPAAGTPPYANGQHGQSVFPHAQAQNGSFQEAPSQRATGQQPFQAVQQHRPTGAYPQEMSHQQPSYAAAQLPAYGQQQSSGSGPQSQPGSAGYPQQGPPAHPQQGPAYGQHAQQYSVPVSQLQLQPDYGPQAQPDYGPQWQHNPQSGLQYRGGPEQNGGSRPQPGMSQQEVAQQAERKRRFTEQKRETQWQQGITQQSNMPSYGPSPPHADSNMQQGPPPLKAPEADVPPMPMGPPPPRLPMQLRMGTMGPPPPRLSRAQGAQVQSQPPIQGLVPYGDDD